MLQGILFLGNQVLPMKMFYSIFSVSVPFMFLFAVGGVFLHHRLLLSLKEKHTEKWKALGSPTLFLNNSPKNCFAVLMFLKNREYLE